MDIAKTMGGTWLDGTWSKNTYRVVGQKDDVVVGLQITCEDITAEVNEPDSWGIVFRIRVCGHDGGMDSNGFLGYIVPDMFETQRDFSFSRGIGIPVQNVKNSFDLLEKMDNSIPAKFEDMIKEMCPKLPLEENFQENFTMQLGLALDKAKEFPVAQDTADEQPSLKLIN